MKLTENFTRQEFDCHDGTIVPSHYLENAKNLAKNLEVIRTKINDPLQVLSGYRTEKYNAKVGGKKNSFHLVAKAGDLITKNLTPKKLYKIILDLINTKQISQGGLGIYDGFVHYDIRGTEARWDLRTKKIYL